MNNLTIAPPVGINRLRKVFKYGLQATDLQLVEMPVGAVILSVQAQSGTPQLWALVDPSPMAEREQRAFLTVGTGHAFDHHATMIHVGTYQMHGGALVFHVFELPHKALPL